MKTSTLNTIRIIAGIVTFLSLALIAYLLLANNGCAGGINVGGNWGSGFELVGEPRPYADDGSYTVEDDIDRLEINWTSGTLKVVVDDGDTIRFNESANSAIGEDQALRYAVKDGTLQILQREFRRTIFNFAVQNKYLTVYWPETKMDALKDVRIETVSATMNIEALRATGEIRLESVSGIQTIDWLEAPAISLEAVSGTITANELHTERLDVETVSGEVKLGLAGMERADVDTVSGSVTLTLLDTDSASLDFNSVSGQQTLGPGVSLTSDADLDLRVGTVSGNVLVQKR